jgi:hypothetical protein
LYEIYIYVIDMYLYVLYIYRWMDGWLHVWMDGCMHACMDGLMDGACVLPQLLQVSFLVQHVGVAIALSQLDMGDDMALLTYD